MMAEPKTGDEIERFAALARADAQSRVDGARQRLLRARFLERVDAELEKSGHGFRRYRWLMPLLAPALVLLVWGLLPRSLEFDVEGAPRDGAYVRAADDHPVTVRFSDQTKVLAAAGSRLRIDETGIQSARVVVERGKTDVHVVHDANRKWTFVAGPFEVQVTGTRFTLDWDPVREMLEVMLTEGAVEVRGPTGSGPIAVRAGQRFRGDAREKSMLLAEAAAKPAPLPSPGSEAVTETAGPPDRTAPADDHGSLARSPASPMRPPSSASDWQQLIARGNFAGIVAEAEARGVDSCLASCSADDLRALSDAARYTGKAGLAEQGLLALRKRFGQGRGRDASFLLGRLAEQRGNMSGGETWYQTYLREAPAGAFAAEALAGSMRATRSLRGSAAARPLARDYLKRFPNGVHSATARQILGEE